MNNETAGQRFIREHPDWPHECCFAGPCPYRAKEYGGENRICESPCDCEYFLQAKKEEQR